MVLANPIDDASTQLAHASCWVVRSGASTQIAGLQGRAAGFYRLVQAYKSADLEHDVCCDALCAQVQAGLHVKRSRLYRTVQAYTFVDLEHDVGCDL
jgi:hypothetical protein